MTPATPMEKTAQLSATSRSSSLDVLRIVAIVGVVAIHVFGAVVLNEQIRGSGTWWAASVVDSGNVWVVPAFVMVSGALLLGQRAQDPGPAGFYRKRLLRLGPAFVFWQVFYIVVVRMVMSHQELSASGIYQLVVDGKTYTHLYFLWLIVGLYAVAPILAAFLKQGGARRAYVFAAVVLAATVIMYSLSGLSAWLGSPRPIVLGAFTQWMPYVGYFLAGWALRNIILNRLWTIVAALATVLLLVEGIVQHGIAPRAAFLQSIWSVSYVGPGTALVVIGVFVVINSAMSRVRLSDRVARVLKALSVASFGTFLIHFFFIILVRVLFPGLIDVLSSSFWAALLEWACIVVISFAISLTALRIPYVRRLF